MSYQHSIVVELVNLIEMNIQHDLSIEKLSDLSGYSKWHLQRMFQRYTGMKIATYIRNRRLSKSAVMLKQSDLKVLKWLLLSVLAPSRLLAAPFNAFR